MEKWGEQVLMERVATCAQVTSEHLALSPDAHTEVSMGTAFWASDSTVSPWLGRTESKGKFNFKRTFQMAKLFDGYHLR